MQQLADDSVDVLFALWAPEDERKIAIQTSLQIYIWYYLRDDKGILISFCHHTHPYILKLTTVQATGFAQGLYNDDEQNSEFYNSKERKIDYLKKMIDLVQLMLKEPIEAKPNKIVAGLEPD